MGIRENKIKGIVFELIAVTLYMGLIFVATIIIMR